MKILNNPKTRVLRNQLRKNQTDAEQLLWSKLRNKQMNGLKFFRQFGIDRYITDFYCPKLKLAIEIDGGGHFTDEGIQYDAVREGLFSSLGIKTTRFSNSEVLNELENVLEKIWALTPPTPSLKKRGNTTEAACQK
jgi:very-short-patch-repair endonuclease